MHLLARPALVLREVQLGQTFRVLYAHAAVAERASRLVEKLALGRVVHVDVVLVREHELHHPKHVMGPRRLDKGKATDIHLAPVDGRGINRVAVVDDAQSLAVENGGVSAAKEEAAAAAG